MPTCGRCGLESELVRACSYCGDSYCADHRLPEKHDCTEVPGNSDGRTFEAGHDLVDRDREE
ncbi:MAG: AN1-type zinc finger domain-containing protein [Halobacteriaceae archaeon]